MDWYIAFDCKDWINFDLLPTDLILALLLVGDLAKGARFGLLTNGDAWGFDDADLVGDWTGDRDTLWVLAWIGLCFTAAKPPPIVLHQSESSWLRALLKFLVGLMYDLGALLDEDDEDEDDEDNDDSENNNDDV